MPESGAVYQPTTVDYTYDSGGDGTGGGGGGGSAGLRHGFWRIMSRHKLSSRKWLEWVLLSVALCFFVAGLAMILVSFVSADDSPSRTSATEVKQEGHTTMTTDIQQHTEDISNSVALGAGIILIGLLFGFLWTWLFFRRSKSPRNGMTGSSGQYGPVLTEVPSQMKMKQTDTPAVPLSDQEEETHTLMQDSASPPVVSVGSDVITNQIPG